MCGVRVVVGNEFKMTQDLRVPKMSSDICCVLFVSVVRIVVRLNLRNFISRKWVINDGVNKNKITENYKYKT